MQSVDRLRHEPVGYRRDDRPYERKRQRDATASLRQLSWPPTTWASRLSRLPCPALLTWAWRRALPPERAWCHREERQPYGSISGRQLFRADRPSMTLVPMTSDLMTLVPMTLDPLATFRRCDHRVPGSSLDHRNCETRNTFATANRAKAFGAISLHRDRSADCA